MKKVISSISFITVMVSQLLFSPYSFATGTKTTINTQQKAQFENIIHDYLVSHPEVLLEASRALQTKQLAAQQEKSKTAIYANKQSLFANPTDPSVGNPKGQVQIVEFFDYQCGHCKNMAGVVKDILSQENDVKVIYKELPIFGGSSEFAAKAALAADKQGKYAALHEQLMSASGRLTNEKILSLAKEVGVNIEQLNKDMASTQISQALAANRELAQALGIRGTPAFIIANSDKLPSMTPFFMPGEIPQAKLKTLIENVR